MYLPHTSDCTREAVLLFCCTRELSQDGSMNFTPSVYIKAIKTISDWIIKLSLIFSNASLYSLSLRLWMDKVTQQCWLQTVLLPNAGNKWKNTTGGKSSPLWWCSIDNLQRRSISYCLALLAFQGHHSVGILPTERLVYCILLSFTSILTQEISHTLLWQVVRD